MAEIFTFRPRKSAVLMSLTAVLEGAALRAEIEQAAQAALDQADRLIALLDSLDGNTDDEDGTGAEPSLAAPEGCASSVVWLWGSAGDGELTS
ncbi:hypothetical protein [Methylorubrum extorquens]